MSAFLYPDIIAITPSYFCNYAFLSLQLCLSIYAIEPFYLCNYAFLSLQLRLSIYAIMFVFRANCVHKVAWNENFSK